MEVSENRIRNAIVAGINSEYEPTSLPIVVDVATGDMKLLLA